ncbi:MAG: hypothetical protein IPK13_26105 [Deltaproteobacteria bacterium]|nr:hypothetical protein [Deltaproteobacteria bacterium]
MTAALVLAGCSEKTPLALVRVEDTAVFDASAASEMLEKEIARGVGNHRAVVAALMTLAPESMPATTLLEITRTPNGLSATAFFDDLADDDSISGYRYALTFKETDQRTLKIDDARQSLRCWPDRGHRDFSTKPCI